MSARRSFDSVEHDRVARPAPREAVPDLFNQPADEPTPPSWSLSGEQDIERQIERMAAIARELGEKAGERGLTISDVRITAENRGVLTGEERGRRLSYLGTVMKRAGLVATNEWRRSDVPRSNGNAHKVWVMRRSA